MWYVVQTMTNEEYKFKSLYEMLNNQKADDAKADGEKASYEKANGKKAGAEKADSEKVIGEKINDAYFGYKLFIPTIMLQRHYQKEWHSVEKVMFPGYVFVETDDIKEFAKHLSDVECFSKLLKVEDEITPISEEEKEFLENMMDENYCVSYSQGFIVGENVVITEGALRNKNALIRKVDRHRRIAMLDIEMFGRRTPVEVGFGAFAKVTNEEWEQIRQDNISRNAHEDNSPIENENDVRVLSGVFEGMAGKLISLDTARNECTVELEIFDRMTRVAFDIDEVEFIK